MATEPFSRVAVLGRDDLDKDPALGTIVTALREEWPNRYQNTVAVRLPDVDGEPQIMLTPDNHHLGFSSNDLPCDEVITTRWGAAVTMHDGRLGVMKTPDSDIRIVPDGWNDGPPSDLVGWFARHPGAAINAWMDSNSGYPGDNTCVLTATVLLTTAIGALTAWIVGHGIHHGMAGFFVLTGFITVMLMTIGWAQSVVGAARNVEHAWPTDPWRVLQLVALRDTTLYRPTTAPIRLLRDLMLDAGASVAETVHAMQVDDELLRTADAVLDDPASTPQARTDAEQAMARVAEHLHQAQAAKQQHTIDTGRQDDPVITEIERRARLQALLEHTPERLEM